MLSFPKGGSPVKKRDGKAQQKTLMSFLKLTKKEPANPEPSKDVNEGKDVKDGKDVKTEVMGKDKKAADIIEETK